MKHNLRNCLQYFRILSFALFMMPLALQAQDEAEAPAAEDLISPSLEFTAVQKNDRSIDLKVAMKAKIKGVFYNLHTLKIKFVRVTDTAEKEIGQLITDARGRGLLNVKSEAVGNEGSVTLKAVYAGNKKIEPADAEVTFKRAYIELTPAKEDSLLTVKAKLVVPGGGADSALKDLTLGLFVNRSFNPLKLGEATTDESGEAVFEVPQGLPGDDKGNLVFIARLDENESFGYLEARVQQAWGKPVSSVIEKQPRALWSSHPPLWMLITFIVLMGVVWGHYLVIVYQLFRLRKEEPAIQA